jgi:hypothetical protein
MTIHEAAAQLQTQLKERPWLTAVGVGVHDGVESIFVYATTPSKVDSSLSAKGWQGFPVVVKKMAKPQLIADPSRRKPA